MLWYLSALKMADIHLLFAKKNVGVSSDLTRKISAVDIVRRAVLKLGGKGGGGRSDLAQGFKVETVA